GTSRWEEIVKTLVVRDWVYERMGHDFRYMTFLADGGIGRGKAKMEIRWSVIAAADSYFLEIYSDRELTCRLRLLETGTWVGVWERFERMVVSIYPADCGGGAGTAIDEAFPRIRLQLGSVFPKGDFFVQFGDSVVYEWLNTFSWTGVVVESHEREC